MRFFQQVVLLCVHFQNYRAVRDVSLGGALWYLARLVALLATVWLLGMVPVWLAQTDEWAAQFDVGRPAFAVEQGQIRTSAPQPQMWGTRDLRFILDTTGTVRQPETNGVNGVLFAADHVVVWLTDTNTTPAVVRSRSGSLRGITDGTVDGAYVRRLARLLMTVGLPLLWVVVLALGLVVTLGQAHLVAVLASWLERGVPAALTFGQLRSIAIHAVTPAAVLYTVYAVLRLEGLDLWLVYMVAYGVFLVGAANACREQRSAAPSRDDDDFFVG